MGAMQSQDFIMAKWAIGVRLPASTHEIVEEAFNKGDIIRTHVMRPTWHFIVKEDVRNLLQISSARILTTNRSRDRQLELAESIFSKSNKIIEKVLLDGKHLTRDEIAAKLQMEGIKTDENRASHLLMRAEMEGIICSGPVKNKRQTYAMLDERVPLSKPLLKEEILATLAQRYFISHGPARLQDFAWWSGVPLGEARKALENVKYTLISETIDSETFWLDGSIQIPENFEDSAYFLPAYDEFIISYADRSASLPAEVNSRAVSSNGLFRPVVVINGQVKGLWKRSLVKEKLRVEVSMFHQPDKKTKSNLVNAIESYGHFLGKEKEIVFD